jgi:hypothetical protein
MTSRRTLFWLCLVPPALAAGEMEKFSGRWRSRITVFRRGRATGTPLRFLFSPDGAFSLEEFGLGGQLAFVYRGAARLNADRELFLDVRTVTDGAGANVEEGRARYEAGESYNLGAVEFLSGSRVRVGALELQKELD